MMFWSLQAWRQLCAHLRPCTTHPCLPQLTLHLACPHTPLQSQWCWLFFGSYELGNSELPVRGSTLRTQQWLCTAEQASAITEVCRQSMLCCTLRPDCTTQGHYSACVPCSSGALSRPWSRATVFTLVCEVQSENRCAPGLARS